MERTMNTYRTTRSFAALVACPLFLNACLMNDPIETSAEAAPDVPPSANSAPVISGTPAKMSKVGVAYDFKPVAWDPDSDKLLFKISNKPSWAEFDSASGEMSGVPFLGSEGTYSVIQISVSDGEMSTALPEFSVTVEPATAPNMPPEIDGNPPDNVIVDNEYSFTPSASDPDGDQLTFFAQNVPAWASFDESNGTLSGTPQMGDDGVYANISISVTDNTVDASLPAFSIRVSNQNSAPTISGTPPNQVTAGQSYDFTPSASDVDSDNLTFTVQGKPDWLTFAPGSGRLSGMPQDGNVGTYSNIQISVSDGSLTTALPAFSIQVDAVALGSATLAWSPPTQNADGSALTDLAGYTIYYGTAPTVLNQSVPITNPGITSYVIESLVPNTWYFSITAVNSAGVESNRSNVASKTIS
jgi:hypothetical protein